MCLDEAGFLIDGIDYGLIDINAILLTSISHLYFTFFFYINIKNLK